MAKVRLGKKEFDLGDRNQRISYWQGVAAGKLKGRKITEAGYAPDAEFGYVLFFRLDNDEVFFVMRDDEGNGPGALHSDSEILPVLH